LAVAWSSHCSLSLALERRFHSTSRSKNSITCTRIIHKQIKSAAAAAQDDRNGRENRDRSGAVVVVVQVR
jgi:hypothetical protein